MAVLFDLPQVVAEVTPPPSERLELAAGDFFADPLPAADSYVLMDLLHDWPDDDATRILAAVRRAAPVGARVLLVETLIAVRRSLSRSYSNSSAARSRFAAGAHFRTFPLGEFPRGNISPLSQD